MSSIGNLPGECIGWWPVGSKHQVYVRVRGTQDTTAAFPYDRPLSTVLALPNMVRQHAEVEQCWCGCLILHH